MILFARITFAVAVFLSSFRLSQTDDNNNNYYYYEEVSFTKLYKVEYQQFLKVELDFDHSCYITFEFFTLAILCPTDVNCYFITYLHQNYSRASTHHHHVHLDSTCQTLPNHPLPVKKVEQLAAVHRVLRLVEETTCAFSSIETLDLRSSGLNNMGQLGGGNCHEVSRCPYQLKYLNFDRLAIESLGNDSFCHFPNLEFLGLTECHLRSIEAHAFVYLVHLREIVMNRNHLRHLPVDLFRNNTQLEAVNLRNNQLQTQALETILSSNSLRYLYLSNNQLTSEGNQWTFPSDLREIFINNNGLTDVVLEFEDVRNLTSLIAANNNISRIDGHAFQNMSEVKVIDLGGNAIKKLHPSTFENNVNLEALILSDNKLIDLPSIAHLGNLKKVYLNNNRIKSIDRSHFNNCSQLSHVDLSYNELISIENGSFDNVRQMQRLNLTHNRLSQLTVYLQNVNVLEINLDFNKFTLFSYENFSPSVRKLSMANNDMERIERLDFTKEVEWSLSHLALHNNKLRFLSHLKLPASIQEVNLSNNQFNETLTILGVIQRGLINLRSVDMRGNNISVLCKYEFLDKVSGRIIRYYISGNPLKCSCENTWLKYPRTSHTFTFVDLEDTDCTEMNPYRNPYKDPGTVVKLAQLPDDAFQCRSNHLNTNRCNCPLDDHIECELPCPTNCTCLSNYYQTNVFFVCSNNNLKHVPRDIDHGSKFYGHSQMNAIYLSGNAISHIETNDFDNFTSKFLILEVDNSGVKSIGNNAFDALIHLQILSLANNEIQVLPDQLFHLFTQLTHLDLSDNRLSHLADDTFSSQVNLQYLYLHGNSLSHIKLLQITRLKHLKNITLEANPWSCDCTFIDSFRTFLVDSSTVVNNKLQLNCTVNEEEFNIPNFNMEDCSLKIHLTILIVSLTFGLISFLTVALMFQWRYELQVLLYVRYGFRMFHQRQLDDVISKQYDAFVAYNSDDTDFLVNQLMPGLEKIENPYRLCIHERDFPAGSYIQDSIIDAISMSSRTIIVLSENFVSSGWCRFEFKSAHMQMLQDRCPRILVIVLGEVPGSLDPEMKLYLKTNTYLQWGERLFWQKLYYAMPDQRVTTPPTDIMPMRDL